MSIEAGARAGMVAPDQTTYDYMQGRPHAPEGADWDAAVEYWNTLHTDADATFDVEVDLDANTLEPFVTRTNPAVAFRCQPWFRPRKTSEMRTPKLPRSARFSTWALRQAHP